MIFNLLFGLQDIFLRGRPEFLCRDHEFPVGESDRRTPEGEFYIFTKIERSAFYLSLGLSYPNAAHAQRGLRDGLITRAQYDAIARALRAKRAPPQNTHLGGDIYIHGNGTQSDWTW